MRRIYLVLLLTIFLGFVAGNKASGQSCDKCPPYHICIPLNFSLPGCDNIMVTLCVRCGVAAPNILWLGVQYDNVCPGYEEQIEQYVNDFIRNNTAAICGAVPCHEQTLTVYFQRPLCGDVYWDGNRYHISAGAANCNNWCLDERAWCWCNCVPGECWDEEKCGDEAQPFFDYRHIQYSQTNPGACEFFRYGYGECVEGLDPEYPFRFASGRPWNEPLRCVQIIWDFDDCSPECSD